MWHNGTVFKQQPYDPVWQQDWKFPPLTKWVTGRHWRGAMVLTPSTDTLSWLSGRDLGKDSGCLSDAVPSESPTGPSQSRLNPSYLLLNIFTRTLHSSGGGPVFVGIIEFIWGGHYIKMSPISVWNTGLYFLRFCELEVEIRVWVGTPLNACRLTSRQLCYPALPSAQVWGMGPASPLCWCRLGLMSSVHY